MARNRRYSTSRTGHERKQDDHDLPSSSSHSIKPFHTVYNWRIRREGLKVLLEFWMPHELAHHSGSGSLGKVFSTVRNQHFYGYVVRVHRYARNDRESLFQFHSKSGHISIATLATQYKPADTRSTLQHRTLTMNEVEAVLTVPLSNAHKMSCQLLQNAAVGAI